MQGTEGATFHEDLELPPSVIVISTGQVAGRSTGTRRSADHAPMEKRFSTI